MSVFLTPPLVQVLHGRRELGLVDRMSFMPQQRGRPTVLSLGGRSWLVRAIDWTRGVALRGAGRRRGPVAMEVGRPQPRVHDGPADSRYPCDRRRTRVVIAAGPRHDGDDPGRVSLAHHRRRRYRHRVRRRTRVVDVRREGGEHCARPNALGPHRGQGRPRQPRRQD